MKTHSGPVICVIALGSGVGVASAAEAVVGTLNAYGLAADQAPEHAATRADVDIEPVGARAGATRRDVGGGRVEAEHVGPLGSGCPAFACAAAVFVGGRFIGEDRSAPE